jgi:tRNA-dihydrouridine synthase A
MITSAAILRGDTARLLRFHPEEHPVALQLGGSDPVELARAARIGADSGYDEINLNCGCPSDRVQSGAFGACLMRDGARVGDCVAAMRAAVRVPVTVKLRIGVVDGEAADVRARVARFDTADRDSLDDVLRPLVAAGVHAIIVHARKAVLGGWSPRDNREIPPLRYDVVAGLKQRFTGLPLVVNGGLRAVAPVLEALTWADGVMLGREAYHNPMLLAELERQVTGVAGRELPSDRELLERMARYAAAEIARGEERLAAITRHMLGLRTHRPGAREYRRLLSEGARAAGAGPEIILRAAELCAAARPSTSPPGLRAVEIG